MDKFHFFPGLVLRSPIYSYNDYFPGNSGIINDSDFRLGIYLASPGFYRILEAKKFDHALFSAKEKLTIAKYYNRMCFRPTPFGTFSAFTITDWGMEGRIQLEKNYNIHLQPDHEVAILTAKYLVPGKESAFYYLNPTLYKQGHEFRYVRSGKSQTGTKLNFALDSLEVTQLTSGIINNAGSGPQNFNQLIADIIEMSGCTHAEAEDTLNSLVTAQVLRPDSDCNISGKNYLTRILTNNVTKGTMNALLPKKVDSKAWTIEDTCRQANEITACLNSYGHEAPEKLFYCNTQRLVTGGDLDRSHQDTLLEAINCLNLLSADAQPAGLATFVKDFTQRFEGRTIPLLQALDPDHGIGYGDFFCANQNTGLLDGIHFLPEKKQTGEIQWSAAHRLLMQKWLQAEPGKPIKLQPKDISALTSAKAELPTSLSVMFRITTEGLQIEHAGGPSALSLIGRFTPFSKEVSELSHEIAKQEQEINSGIIFAEIGQLSDDHTDNINKRESIYTHEIPINSISLLDQEHQLPPSDLLVSVRNGEIILESAKNGKRVIPRLSTAYNFNHNQLPLFRFVCDLQYQSIQSCLQLNMEQLFPDMPYYPRVQFGDTILSPATWHIKQEDIRGASLDRLHNFCQAKNIPALVALTHADQQLVFDLSNDTQSQLFLQVTATMEHFTLREFFLPSATAVCDEKGAPMVNQFITFLVNEKTVYAGQAALPASIVSNKTKRDYILGSGWLYLKIYCNSVSANRVLLKHILSVIKDLTTEAPIVWFFIRYADPKPHIRLRIKIAETNAGPVIALFKKRVSGLIKDSVVREYQADTYRRELDRYGADIINLVEKFFYASSELVMAYLPRNPEESRQHHLAISSMAIMLNMAFTDINEQVAFIAAVKENLYREFIHEKSVRIELDLKYREIKNTFLEIGNGNSYLKKMKLSGAHRLFVESFSTIIRRSAKFDSQRRNALVADLIHMHLNRVFSSQQRRQEFVLYYFFYKYKISESYANTKHLPVAAAYPG